MPIEKETITTENIIIDCKKQFFQTVGSAFIFAPLSSLLSVSLVYKLITAYKLDHIIISLIPLPICLILLAASIRILLIEYKNYNSILQKKFKVTTDKLVNSINEVRTVPGKTINRKERPCTLQFKLYGDFNIFGGTFYHSSKQYKMWYDELFRSSKIGDEFYLAVDDKNNILIVYNTKFFYLQEQ